VVRWNLFTEKTDLGLIYNEARKMRKGKSTFCQPRKLGVNSIQVARSGEGRKKVEPMENSYCLTWRAGQTNEIFPKTAQHFWKSKV